MRVHAAEISFDQAPGDNGGVRLGDPVPYKDMLGEPACVGGSYMQPLLSVDTMLAGGCYKIAQLSMRGAIGTGNWKRKPGDQDKASRADACRGSGVPRGDSYLVRRRRRQTRMVC